jgi:hypothetical protein
MLNLPHTYSRKINYKNKTFNSKFLIITSVATIIFTSIFFVSAASAAPPIGLGTANSFAVLAGSGITNSGSTTINGNIGTFPTPAITGYGSITHTGTNHADDNVTQGAKNDIVTAYNQAAGAASPTAVATELGGSTLTPGVYNNGTLGITGTLTLDTQGDPNAVFIFQASTTLITAANSNVVFLNGANSCNVYWQVGSSVTLGTNSFLEGTVLSAFSISANTGAQIHGRLLALDGAVTLLSNTINIERCGTPTIIPTNTTTVPSSNGANGSSSNGTGQPSGSTSSSGGLDGTLADSGFNNFLFFFAITTIGVGIFALGLTKINKIKKVKI